MSLAVAVSCGDGVAISSEGLIALDVTTDGAAQSLGVGAVVTVGPEADVAEVRVPFHNDATKLAVMAGGQAIVSWAGTSRALSPQQTFEKIGGDRRVRAAGHDPAAFIQAVAELGTQVALEAALLVGWIDAGGFPCLSSIQWPTGAVVHYHRGQGGQRVHALIPIGVADAARFVRRMVDITEVPLANFSLDQAARFSRFAVQSAISYQDFRARPRYIGGQVTTAVVDRDGARIVTPRAFALRDYATTEDV